MLQKYFQRYMYITYIHKFQKCRPNDIYICIHLWSFAIMQWPVIPIKHMLTFGWSLQFHSSSGTIGHDYIHVLVQTYIYGWYTKVQWTNIMNGKLDILYLGQGSQALRVRLHVTFLIWTSIKLYSEEHFTWKLNCKMKWHLKNIVVNK